VSQTPLRPTAQQVADLKQHRETLQFNLTQIPILLKAGGNPDELAQIRQDTEKEIARITQLLDAFGLD